ncbi:MAG: DUF2892 domain-containing protein [Bacteroidota bacterium]|nr:DUF2892 domain-containing protein [Bacteroidota bacterium]
MKQNMGSIDRILRVIIAAIFAWLYFSDTVTGTWGLVLVIIGGIFVVTSLVGICPLYAILGLRSSPKKSVTK